MEFPLQMSVILLNLLQDTEVIEDEYVTKIYQKFIYQKKPRAYSERGRSSAPPTKPEIIVISNIDNSL